MPPGEYTITINQINMIKHDYKTLYRFNTLNAIPVFILKSVKTGRIKMRPDFTDPKYLVFSYELCLFLPVTDTVKCRKSQFYATNHNSHQNSMYLTDMW